MPVINWLYGTAISGVPFPMVTASGTLAAGYTPGTMSAVLSKDGGAWADLSGRISGIPGNGVYTLVSLSSTEMACYTWAAKISAASGCLDQILVGVNGSGPALATTISGFATLDSVSGLPGIAASISGLNTSNLISQCSSIYASISGIPGIASAISGLNTSNLIAQCSSILAGISSVPSGVGLIPTTTSTVLASGTLAHDSRLIRRFAWGDLTIDKRYTPYRMYLQDDAGNMSSYFELTDDSNTTVRDKA